MLKQYAKSFAELEVWLQSLSINATIPEIFHPGNLGPMAPEQLKYIDQWLETAESLCKDLKLKMCLEHINWMRINRTEKHDWMFRSLDELRRRIDQELNTAWFLYVPVGKVSYWENELYFGEDVAEKIPDAREDIYEACSCFAVGRYSATVYHCVGIMQAAFFQVGKTDLNCIIDLDVDDWGSVTRKIQQAVDKLEERAKAQSKDAAAWAKWKTIEPLYNELISDVNAVKKAWRHTSAHFRQKFKEEQAEKVLDKVEDFMKTVAKLLP